MDDMKKGVLTKALGMLTVLGCKYAVIDPEGNKYGELDVVPPKAARTRKPSGINYQAMYLDQVKAITGPSDTIHEFVPPHGIPIEGLRSAIAAWCTKWWGKDTYTSQVKDGKVLLIRYA